MLNKEEENPFLKVIKILRTNLDALHSRLNHNHPPNKVMVSQDLFKMIQYADKAIVAGERYEKHGPRQCGNCENLQKLDHERYACSRELESIGDQPQEIQDVRLDDDGCSHHQYID